MTTAINILLFIILLPIALFSILLSLGLICYVIESIQEKITERKGAKSYGRKET